VTPDATASGQIGGARSGSTGGLGGGAGVGSGSDLCGPQQTVQGGVGRNYGGGGTAINAGNGGNGAGGAARFSYT
jgi:hypothetical protein